MQLGVYAPLLTSQRDTTQRANGVQIEAEFKRFCKYMDPEVRVGMFVGGIAVKTHMDLLADESKRPHIVIGTPGRLLDLTKKGKMVLDNIKYFIVDECDKVLDQAGESPSMHLVLEHT